MPEIREIQIRDLDVPPVPDWLMQYTHAIPPVVPVTQNIGLPIVDMPGCVESHPDSGNSNILTRDDENGTMTYCDGTVPSYNPINFEPEQIIPTAPAGVDTGQKETPKPPGQVEIPKAAPPTTVKVDCPTLAQEAKEPVGTFVEGFRKKVIEYKLLGNECVQITEAVPIPQQIVAGLPSPGTVMTTGGVAVIATSSALMAKPLADVLLKVIKPTVKKVMKKIAAIRGKTVPVLSTAERRNEQRARNHAIMELRQTLKPK